MNILSLFDGMSCGMIAAERAGLKVDNYYASEIDKYSQIVSSANYPQIKRFGDVTRWKEWGIDWSSIDLLIGGSPCQGFSFAGKQLAFDDPRSKLFFVYVDILNHIKSENKNVKFLLENVKMKKEYLDVISEKLGVNPVFINSNLVSAQNRQRYYWCNWEVPQPEDEGVHLSEIIENSIPYHKKSWGINANYWKGATVEQFFKKSRRELIFFIGRGNNPSGFRAIDGKTPSLTSNCYEANNFLADKTGYRKLTPIECERLQTVPDNYTNHVSNTQRYKMLGNGWTVDVIAHIFSCMEKE